MAQPLRPRYYSTSSSPRIHGDGVAHLTVGLEATPVPGQPGRDFRGMSSHYLHALREGDRLNVFLDSADGFHLQDDVTKPMIFVSAGTGFAPMRAFLWERLALKRAGVPLARRRCSTASGRAASTTSTATRSTAFAAEGVLDHVHIAHLARAGRTAASTSRTGSGTQGALVWRLLAAGGYVYVCGSQPMRDAVRAAFVDVVARTRVDAARAGGGLRRRAGDDRLTTAQTSGADPWEPHGRPRPDPDPGGPRSCSCSPPAGRELRRFNEIALGLVLLTAALICQFTSITNTHIGR